MSDHSEHIQDHQPEGRKNQFNWLLFFIFITVVVSLVLIGIWFYDQQARSIKAGKFEELNSIADLKVDQIIKWRKERISDAIVNSSNPFLKNAVNQWLTDPNRADLEESIVKALTLLKNASEYENILVVDGHGDIRLSLRSEITEIDPETSELISRALMDNKIIIGDFYRSEAQGKVYLDVIAPFENNKSQPVGAMILRVDPEYYLFPLIQTWPTLSETAETLLLRKEDESVLFLNTLRHVSNEPLSLQIPLSSTDVPAVQAVLNKSGDFEGVDYRGIEVISEIVPVTGTPWFMIAKVDRLEILSEIRLLWITVFVLVIVSIFLVSALAAFFYRDHQKQLFHDLFKQERKLRELQEEAKTTLYSIGDGVITTDSKGIVTRLNPVAENLTGWKEAEAVGQKLNQVFKIIHENTRLEVENPVDRILLEGKVIGLANHTLLISKDGQERPIADSGAPILNDKQGITGVVLVFRDQTKERDVQKEKALLTDTIRSSLNEIYIFDSKTYKFRFANDGAIHNIGYSLEQLKNMTPLDIKPVLNIESFEELIKPLRDHTKDKLVFETIHLRSNGSEYPAEVHLQLFDQGDEEVFLAVINDISERKAAESDIKLKDELLVMTGEMAKVGGWEFDAVSLKGTWTDQVAEIHDLEPGLETNVALGISFYTADSRKKIEDAINQAVELSQPYDLELDMVSAKGISKTVRTMGIPIIEDGKVVKVRGIFQDITERKQAELALHESEICWQFALQGAGDGLWDWNAQTNEVYYSSQWKTMLGYEEGDIGNTLDDWEKRVHPDDIKQCYDDLELHFQKMTPIYQNEHRMLCKDGSYKWILDRGKVMQWTEDGKPKRVIGIHSDISKRKQNDEILNEQLDELNRWREVTIGRESRIMELKHEINTILIKFGQQERYANLTSKTQEVLPVSNAQSRIDISNPLDNNPDQEET